MEERVPTGIEGFDSLIEGGISRGSLVLVADNPGAGKTILSAQCLYHGALDLNEPGIYASLAEDRGTFLRNMKRLGMDFEKLEQDGKFSFMDLITVTEKGVGDVLTSVLEETSRLKAKRLVIDSFSALMFRFSGLAGSLTRLAPSTSSSLSWRRGAFEHIRRITFWRT
jgi:circadian clock protein KaiC